MSTDLIQSALTEMILVSLDVVKDDHGLSSSDIEKFLEVPSDTSKGDFAFPCFKLAKAFRKAPAQIAAEIAPELEKNSPKVISKIEVAGGYINFFINSSELANTLFDSIRSGVFFKADPENLKIKVMIEYSQPNTHKEFHVGHGRNVCLGDTITRLYKYAGFNTVPVNYIGDEGAHIAKCLLAVKHSNEKVPETKRAQWLGGKYVEAGRMLADADEETKKNLESEMSEILAAIESKQGETYQLWKETKQYCMDDFNDIYKWLDVHFDHFFFESDVSEASQQVVDKFLKLGVFKISQGAVGIDMSDDKLGFMMVRKSDGNGLYITKDIALAQTKFDEFGIQKNIYIVGNEQDYHFKQLFNFFKIAKFEHAAHCQHLSYGMVVRPDGKMSSRSGNSFTFFNLVEVIVTELNKYMDKYRDEWDTQQIEETVHRLAVGAIKFGMISTDPSKEIIFDPEQWVRFDGQSGPYLMYGYSRSRSIIEKAKAKGLKPSSSNRSLLTDPTENDLIVKMYRFNEAALGAYEYHRPSMLSTYLFELCKTFNQFYVQVPVLKSQDKDLIEARLELIENFGSVLKKGLFLLGITPPERM
jgi:arginyl-tRNA synthetase